MSFELVAREEEFAVLTAFLADAPARPAALVLEGEAGMGKSTLWSAVAAPARERGLRLGVRSRSELARRPAPSR